jgi:hypothetical protein
MLEGAPGQWSKYGQRQWIASANRAIKLINANKIIIFESYLQHATDYRQRMYWLGTYLLLRGRYTYITYFKRNPFEYFPEFEINIGAPRETAKSINDLRHGELFVRDFTAGQVVVNSADRESYFYSIPPGSRMARVRGGGAIGQSGKITGQLRLIPVSGRVRLPPRTALILVDHH